jgi:hypothetical protein
MTEEHPYGERRLMNNELHEQEEQPHFEHVTVKEEPSFNESTLIKEEMDPVQMKEELDSDNEQPFMSPVREEAALDKNRVALNVPVVDVVQEEVSSHCSSDQAMSNMATIVSNEEIFTQFTNDVSRKQYKRTWLQFVEFCEDFDLEAGPPGEKLLIKYFKFLRFEKKVASSSLWTVYSCLNSIMKKKYSVRLQEIPGLSRLIKGFTLTQEVKPKAAIFDDVLMKDFMLGRMENAYWLVRQAICIVAFFGGLRLQECMDLVLEKIQRGKEGHLVTYRRAKQRSSDKLEGRFLVPDAGGFAAQLDLYLFKVNNQLEKCQGRVWFTGTQSEMLKSLPMGKNMISSVPYDIATVLSLPDPSLYTFHSFRRTSSASAAFAQNNSEISSDM